MAVRPIWFALCAAAVGVLAGAIGVVSGAQWLTAFGLLLTVGSGVVVAYAALRDLRQREEPPARESVPTPETGAPAIERTPDRPDNTGLSLSEPRGVEPEDVLTWFMGSVAHVGRVRSTQLWMLDDTTRTLRLVEAVGPSRPKRGPLPVADGPIGDALARGVATLAQPEAGTPSIRKEEQWLYALPISAGYGRGVAVAEFTGVDPDRDLLTRLASHARGSLSAALALHLSRSESASAGALLQAVAEIARLVDETAVLETTLAHAITLSEAHTGSIMLFDEDEGLLRIRASSGLPEDVVEATAITEGEGIAGWVFATGKPLVVEDLDDRGLRSRRHGVLSAAAVPIAEDGTILGVLNVGSRVFHARFSSTHLSALESLGRVLALALQNARAHASARELYLDTVKALALALETKDPYSRGATERVLELAERLGTAAGMREAELQGLRIAALVHDIGMTAAGDLHGLAHRPLSTVEWGMLKLHPVIAADVLAQAPALRAAIPMVYHHHEHFDGGGYVAGLAGEEIPLGARVLAVADSFVAMTSPRAYRKALTADQAIDELVAKSGSQYDPIVVRALTSLIPAVESASVASPPG